MSHLFANNCWLLHYNKFHLQDCFDFTLLELLLDMCWFNIVVGWRQFKLLNWIALFQYCIISRGDFYNLALFNPYWCKWVGAE